MILFPPLPINPFFRHFSPIPIQTSAPKLSCPLLLHKIPHQLWGMFPPPPLRFPLIALLLSIFIILSNIFGTNAFLFSAGGCGCGGGGSCCSPSCCVLKPVPIPIPMPYPVPVPCCCCPPPPHPCCAQKSCCTPCACCPRPSCCCQTPCSSSPCCSSSCCGQQQSSCCSQQCCCSQQSSSCCCAEQKQCSSSCCSSSSSFNSFSSSSCCSSTFFATQQNSMANNFIASSLGIARPSFGCAGGGCGGIAAPLAATAAGGCGAGGCGAGPRPPAAVIGCGGGGGGPMAFGGGLPFAGMPIGYGGFGMPMAYGNPAAGGSAASMQSPPTIYVIGGSPLVGNGTKTGAGKITTTANPEEIQTEIEESLGPKRTKTGKKKGGGGSNNSGTSQPKVDSNTPQETGPGVFELIPTVSGGQERGDGLQSTTAVNVPSGGSETEVPAAAKETETEESTVSIGGMIEAPPSNSPQQNPQQQGTSPMPVPSNNLNVYAPPLPNQTFKEEGKSGKNDAEEEEGEDEEDGEEEDEEEEYEDEEEEGEGEEGMKAKKRRKKARKKWKVAASKLLKMAARASDKGLYERRDRLLRKLRKKLNFRRTKRVSNGKEDGIKPKKKCNSPKLGRVIGNSIVEQVSIAKKLVRRAIEHSFPRLKFDVICSTGGDFSYSFYARRYCEVQRKGITCVAFD